MLQDVSPDTIKLQENLIRVSGVKREVPTHPRGNIYTAPKNERNIQILMNGLFMLKSLLMYSV